MIFVTSGTCVSFDRLFKRLDEIALELDGEEIIAQIGHSTYEPENYTYFRFAPSLEKYYNAARLIVSHGGFSTMEIIKAGKALIVVPRQFNLAEHFDNHQVEFAELLNKKLSVKYVVDIEKLDAVLLRNYHKLVTYSDDNLFKFREKILSFINA